MTAEESQDGKHLYFVKADTVEGIGALWKMPIEGGEEKLVLEQVHRSSWAMTDRRIYNLNATTEPYSIEVLDLRSGDVRQVSAVTLELFVGGSRYLSISPKEEWLVLVARKLEADLMLVENFR